MPDQRPRRPRFSRGRSRQERIWAMRSQLELAAVEYVGWFNNSRLHENLGDRPPAEFEALYAVKDRHQTTIIAA